MPKYPKLSQVLSSMAMHEALRAMSCARACGGSSSAPGGGGYKEVAQAGPNKHKQRPLPWQ